MGLNVVICGWSLGAGLLGDALASMCAGLRRDWAGFRRNEGTDWWEEHGVGLSGDTKGSMGLWAELVRRLGGVMGVALEWLLELRW